MLPAKLLLHSVTFYLLTYAYGIPDDDNEYPFMLTGPERQLFWSKKRAGARSFRLINGNNLANFLFPNNKHHQTLLPYYNYQQLKRGGGHPFRTFWTNPLNEGDLKFVDDLPFYEKRFAFHDSDEYIY